MDLNKPRTENQDMRNSDTFSAEIASEGDEARLFGGSFQSSSKKICGMRIPSLILGCAVVFLIVFFELYRNDSVEKQSALRSEIKEEKMRIDFGEERENILKKQIEALNAQVQLLTTNQVLSSDKEKLLKNQISLLETQLSNTHYENYTYCAPLDFYEVAKQHGTDKVNDHRYHVMYSKYFPQIRCEPIRLLEIGLGCDMSYGPGASFYLWLQYFPNAQIFFIEYDVACAEKYMNIDPRVKLFGGDQANVTFLNEVIEKSQGNFDFIIDDGGHTMVQQITSLETLFHTVKVGGIYFIEDLLTSYGIDVPRFGGGADAPYGSTVHYMKELIDDIHTRGGKVQPQKRKISSMMSGVECTDEICAMTRRTES